MTARYLIRLDDIAPHMAWDRFWRLAQCFVRHGIKPLLGVIPDNHDPQLLAFPECETDFWEEMRAFQSRGWEIAQHGERHVYVTQSSGMVGVNGLSEFAGLPYDVQFEKLARGRRLLRERGLDFETFMAPSHSYDHATLRALRELGFTTVTDGFAAWPYVENELVFVPQLFEMPRTLPFGVHTFCLHVNVMTEAQLVRVEQFATRHAAEFLTFCEARLLATPGQVNRIAGRVIGAALRRVKKWRRARRLKAA